MKKGGIKMIKIGLQDYLIILRLDDKRNKLWAVKWRKDAGWSLCYQRSQAVQWVDIDDDLSILDFMDILQHFGLRDFAGEFSAKKILSMSPAQLANEKRKKEESCNKFRYIAIIERGGTNKHLPAKLFDW